MTGAPEDPYGLARFVAAQGDGRPGSAYAQAIAELRAGRKRSHWMWFVFPQIAGLGISPTSILYAIGSAAEAGAYLVHPLLGPRLRECTEALLAHNGAKAEAILGSVDAIKLRSSMTLFDQAAPGDGLFDRCLALFFEGRRDEATLRLLAEFEASRH
jgi:uncharacterized protein (DUF1810 family)